jgi:Skp family chaperone for outer membrane proteins
MKFTRQLPLAAVLLSLLPVAAFAQAAPAAAPATRAAQMPPKQVVAGIGIVNRDEVIAASNAFRNAQSERQVVFKNQIAMAEARRKQLNAVIEPQVAKLQQDQRSGGSNAAELQQRSIAIQSQQNAGVRELQEMLAPIARSEAYATELLLEAFNKALIATMDKRGLTLIMPSQSPLAFNNAYSINAAVLAELNTILPRVTVVPPESWRPRAKREAAGAQQAPSTPAASAPAQRRRGN